MARSNIDDMLSWFKESLCPWLFETFILLLTLWAELVHKTADLLRSWGVSGATSVMFRHLSPPRMSVLCRKGSFSDSQPLAIISPGNTVNWSPWSLMLLDGGLGRVLPSMKCRHSLCRWCTWIEFILNEHKVTALCCQKLGGWVPGKCHMFACYLLVREENFHSTLEVRCWQLPYTSWW